MNLYEILGVDKKSTPTQIKKAYRAISKTKHPDVGGSNEEFREIKTAFDVLSDREKRKLYDEHGIITNEPEDVMKKWVLQQFTTAIQEWLKNKVNPRKQTPSFGKFLRGGLNNSKQQAEQALENFKAQLKTAKKYLEYATIEGSTENIFTTTIKQIIEDTNREIANAELFLYKLKMVETELDKYKFDEMDEVQTMTWFINTTTHTGTTTTYS